jgi:hypothetical protein
MDLRDLGNVFGQNKTQELLPQRYEQIQTSSQFQIVHQVPKIFAVFKVN